MSIAPRTTIGRRTCFVTLDKPGPNIPDGHGGWTQTPVALAPPTWFCRIEPAASVPIEQFASGTALSRATYVMTGPFHPGITTTTRVHFKGRVFHVNGVATPEMAEVETILYCEELLDIVGPSEAGFQGDAFQPGAFQGAR
jgi:head-tail adaptor